MFGSVILLITYISQYQSLTHSGFSEFVLKSNLRHINFEPMQEFTPWDAGKCLCEFFLLCVCVYSKRPRSLISQESSPTSTYNTAWDLKMNESHPFSEIFLTF